jgi:hypothetical protein
MVILITAGQKVVTLVKRVQAEDVSIARNMGRSVRGLLSRIKDLPSLYMELKDKFATNCSALPAKETMTPGESTPSDTFGHAVQQAHRPMKLKSNQIKTNVGNLFLVSLDF